MTADTEHKKTSAQHNHI